MATSLRFGTESTDANYTPVSSNNTSDNIAQDVNTPLNFSTTLTTTTDRLDEEYKMDHPNRGKAIIFNHEHFDEHSTRIGTKKDCQDLKECLEKLKFDVEVCPDYTCNEIQNKIANIAKQDHSKNDCLLIAIMSHGLNSGFICAKDHPYKFENIWKCFTANKCPSLAGKPKLFFIQACRGDQYEDGILMQRTQTDGDPSSVYYSIPDYADFLLAYSTMSGFYSWRSTVNGSWFIQSLCLQLKNNYNNYDLLSLLTFVSHHVAIDYQTYVTENNNTLKKQIPCVKSTLTRLLHFSDGNASVVS